MQDIYFRYGIDKGNKTDLLEAIIKKYRMQSRADGTVLYNKGDLLILASNFNSEVPDPENFEKLLVRTTITQQESQKSVDEYDLHKYIGNLLTVMIEGTGGFIISIGLEEIEAYLSIYFARPVTRGTEFGIIFKRINDIIAEITEELKICLREL